MASEISISGSGTSVQSVIKEAIAVKSTRQDTGVVHATNSKELQMAELQGARVTTGDEQIVRAIERAFKAIQGPNTTVEVSVHEQTKQIMVKVLDQDTGKIIREVPPEKILDLVANMMQVAGLLVDERR
ncbi:flagellar protein FlaG [Paenibacillus sp. RC67]|uniref:flagellar protein FlaG n=1 Tax=Paenibacillus sp. RC67 TaxID=3039392 RepID=UPI0024AD002F|nr:flagellar protein FlaG [Paenibacillus sp. RC67]